MFFLGISNIDHSALEVTILVGSLQGWIQKVKVQGAPWKL